MGYVAVFFPLGGFAPLQSETLSNVAARLNAKPMGRVALASADLAGNICSFPEHHE